MKAGYRVLSLFFLATSLCAGDTAEGAPNATSLKIDEWPLQEMTEAEADELIGTIEIEILNEKRQKDIHNAFLRWLDTSMNTGPYPCNYTNNPSFAGHSQRPPQPSPLEGGE